MKRSWFKVFLCLMLLTVPLTVQAADKDPVFTYTHPFVGVQQSNTYTVTITSTNTSTLIKTLVEAQLPGVVINWGAVKGMIISVEDYDVRIAFGTDPTQAGLGHIMYARTTPYWPGNYCASNGKIISKTADQHGKLQITLEF